MEPRHEYTPLGIVPGHLYAVTDDERNLAMLSHLLGVVSGFVGPLVILLTKAKESTFVRDQAAEALSFYITTGVAMAISAVLCLVLVGYVLLPAVAIVHVVYGIIATTRANRGIAYRYPVNVRLVRAG